MLRVQCLSVDNRRVVSLIWVVPGGIQYSMLDF